MSRTTNDRKTNHVGLVVNDITKDFLEFRARQENKSRSEIARQFIFNALKRDKKFKAWHKIYNEITGS